MNSLASRRDASGQELCITYMLLYQVQREFTRIVMSRVHDQIPHTRPDHRLQFTLVRTVVQQDRRTRQTTDESNGLGDDELKSEMKSIKSEHSDETCVSLKSRESRTFFKHTSQPPTANEV